MLIAAGGTAFLKPSANNFQRIDTHFSENNPRQGIVSPVFNVGDNILDLSGIIPSTAKFVKLGITMSLKASGVLGTFNTCALHSMYDNPGTIFCESGRFSGYEFAAIAVGTEYISQTMILTAPLLPSPDNGKVNIQLIVMPAGGLVCKNFFVFGYWD